MYLNCPECHLSLHIRWPALLIEHCPRCIARRQQSVPLVTSDMPYRTPLAAGRLARGGNQVATGRGET